MQLTEEAWMCGSSGTLRLSACAWTNCPLHVPSLNPSKALATILGTLEHGTVVNPWYMEITPLILITISPGYVHRQVHAL